MQTNGSAWAKLFDENKLNDHATGKYKTDCKEYIDAICPHAFWHVDIIIHFACGFAGLGR